MDRFLTAADILRLDYSLISLRSPIGKERVCLLRHDGVFLCIPCNKEARSSLLDRVVPAAITLKRSHSFFYPFEPSDFALVCVAGPVWALSRSWKPKFFIESGAMRFLHRSDFNLSPYIIHAPHLSIRHCR